MTTSANNRGVVTRFYRFQAIPSLVGLYPGSQTGRGEQIGQTLPTGQKCLCRILVPRMKHKAQRLYWVVCVPSLPQEAENAGNILGRLDVQLEFRQ